MALGSLTKYILLTSGTSWTVPSDFTTGTVHLIGGGGAGNSAGNKTGGGGGGYAAITSFSPTAGSSFTYAIGAAGTSNGAGGNTTIIVGGTTVTAGGGGAGTSGAGGTGGSSTTYLYSAGSLFLLSSGSNNGGSGSSLISGGGGGGAGGTITSGVSGGSGSTGGAGNGGAGGAAGLPGTEIGGLYGSGGGASAGGTAGLYGGGGCGGVVSGAGAQGAIIIQYTISFDTSITGFKTKDPNTSNSQDLSQRYITKDYLLDVYPNIVGQTGNRTSPGLYAWGANAISLTSVPGNLGLSDITHRSSPVQVGSLNNWKQIDGSYYSSFAVKTDGTLWAWGNNTPTLGNLGLGDMVHRSSPTQVGGLTGWKLVSSSNYTVAAIKTDGTLWMWGINDNGQLGVLNVTGRSSPTQIGSLTNWKQVSPGLYHTLAIKTDGTLWGWGKNGSGAPTLGLNDLVHRSSPVQVGSLTNWKQVSSSVDNGYSAAVKTDGTLWTWGGNFNGQLGLNNLTNRSSPTQVGSLTNWKLVAACWYHCLAIKTDGTLWAWGHNESGQLGLGNITHRSSPVQVGSLTNWKQVATIKRSSSIAIKTDGTLWAWGDNSFGWLGLSNTSNRSSPTQVGSLTNWKLVASGTPAHTLAIADGSIGA